MLGKTYEAQTCSIARALEIVGERWTLLLLRDAVFAGLTRFTDFQHSLGIAPNVLQQRLEDLVDAGLLERRLYSPQPELAEYLTTERARALTPVLLALSDWGDALGSADGAPVLYRHPVCGGAVTAAVTCENCGVLASSTPLDAEMGAGMSESRIAVMTDIFASRARDGRLAVR